MCRIAGYIGPLSDRRVSLILRGLVIAEEKSNPHGTGILVRNLDSGKCFLQKKGIRGRDFLVRGYADFLWQRQFHWAFVHVRYMTSGKQSDRCAHPFGFRVKGVWHFAMHNGVFSDAICEALSDEFGCSKAAVDSETFFWAMQQQQNKGISLVEAIKNATEFVSANAEFAFAYMARDAVYLWRSEERPLSVFDLRERGLGRWFASTPKMFQKALQIAGVEIKEISYFDLKPFKLYKLGHQTTPRWEVEAICDIPRREKPKPTDLSLFDLEGNNKEEVLEDPATFSTRKLKSKIWEVYERVMRGETELEPYLLDLKFELDRRKKGGAIW